MTDIPTRGWTIARDDPEYPHPLRHIHDPPDVLYVETASRPPPPLDGLAVAVVGARDATGYGVSVARALGRGLAEAGYTVVSGLALGIDAAAHAGALEAGGPTVAVTGCGTDVVYPRRNRGLRRRILASGLLVSEWPPGTSPRPAYFPLRNRILSGLTLGVVVVEATARSGSLITARLALEQGREVFAVPGPAGVPRSSGPHRLLKEGACLVENVHDILDELPTGVWRAEPRRPTPVVTVGGLFEALGEGMQTVDQLAARMGKKTHEIWADLLALELRGQVVRGPGGRFAASLPTTRGVDGSKPEGLTPERAVS